MQGENRMSSNPVEYASENIDVPAHLKIVASWNIFVAKNCHF